MQAIAQILNRANRRLSESQNSPDSATAELPEGWCERCGEVHECPLCHDARRVRRPIVLLEGENVTDAQERDPGMGKSEPCRCVQTPASDTPRMLERMNIPERLKGATLATWLPNNAEPRKFAQNFAACDPWPGELFFLTLVGPPGRGKTHLAVGAMKMVLALHGVGGRFVVVPDLLRRIRATFDEETRTETAENVFGEMTSCRLLCMDDLGAEKATEWAAEQVFTIINHRWAHQMPTIITTNLSTASLDERVFSRICDRQTSVLVSIDGERFPDRRLA